MRPQLRKRLIFIYEVILPILAIFSMLSLIALGEKYFHPEEQPVVLYVVDHLIWLVFMVDFCIRICFATSFKFFIATHLSEFISLLPSSPFIFVLYLLDLSRWRTGTFVLMEIIFLVKFLAYLGRCYSMQSRFFKTNLLHYAGGITIVSLVVAAQLFSICEEISYGDSIWFSLVTMSTTGYGDIVPHTAGGRMVAIFLMVAGVACITAFTSILASRILKAPDRMNSKNPHIEAIETQIRRFALLSEDEVEEMCIILKDLKAHQKVTGKLVAEEIRDFNEKEEKKLWSSLPFVRWVRAKCAGFMDDSIEIDHDLSAKKEKED